MSKFQRGDSTLPFRWDRSTSEVLLEMVRDAMSYLPTPASRHFAELDEKVEFIIRRRSNSLHVPHDYLEVTEQVLRVLSKEFDRGAPIPGGFRGVSGRHPMEYMQHILGIYKSLLDYEFTKFESSYKNVLTLIQLVLFGFRSNEEEDEDKMPHVDFKRRWQQRTLMLFAPPQR